MPSRNDVKSGRHGHGKFNSAATLAVPLLPLAVALKLLPLLLRFSHMICHMKTSDFGQIILELVRIFSGGVRQPYRRDTFGTPPCRSHQLSDVTSAEAKRI